MDGVVSASKDAVSAQMDALLADELSAFTCPVLARGPMADPGHLESNLKDNDRNTSR